MNHLTSTPPATPDEKAVRRLQAESAAAHLAAVERRAHPQAWWLQ